MSEFWGEPWRWHCDRDRDGGGGRGTTAVSFPHLNTDPLIRILSTEVVSNSIKPTTSSGSPAVVLV